MTLNHLGLDEAHAIRENARRLVDIDGLGRTSSLREVLLDLSYALDDLAEPIADLTEAWVKQSSDGVPPDGDLPDVRALLAIAADLRQLADNT